MKRSLIVLALGALSSMPACSSGSHDVVLQGSGATFPAPLYKRWFLDYYAAQPAVRVNYSPIGSGAGIRQFTAGLVMFGASDAGMSKKEIDKLPPSFGGVLLLPMTAGCIVLAYNLESVKAPLRLPRDVYLKIFLRQIVRWRDAQITAANPTLELPDQPITVVTRADSSGTTYAFTSHMAAVAKASNIDWSPGVDKSVHWKESIAAQGNDGVAALVQLTPGAIGYIEYGYAHLAGLPMAALENRHHDFVIPDERGEAGGKALADAKIPDDLQIKVPDPEAAGAYPIVTYTWLLTRRHYDDAQEAHSLKALLLHSLEDEPQRVAQQLGYLRLPDAVASRLRDELSHLP